MLRAWGNELIWVAIGGLAVLLVGNLVGQTGWFLGAGLAAYLGWHVANLLRLQHWCVRGDRFRLPVSVGVWESIFDGLQRRQLRARRRAGSLVRTRSDDREAAGRLPDALVALDADNRIVWFNGAAHRLFGLRRPDDIGRDVTDLLRHPLLKDSLADSGVGRSVEIPAPANAAWMLTAHVTAAFGQNGLRMLVARDITSHHRVDQVRRDFVTNVSHELRTPITVFRGFLDPLRGMAEAEELQRFLGLMDDQAQRMEMLVDDLLTLSRLEMGGRPLSEEAVPVAEMLQDIVAAADALSAEREHSLSVRADPTLCLHGDRRELYSAFSNLVFNAVRHTPPGTRIDISWQHGPDGPMLCVQDHGEGIAPQHLSRLTERFYRVDPSRARRSGGTGLGLAIVKHVLERHDAHLKIASRPGAGSSFICQFPPTRAEQTAADPYGVQHARRA